MLRRTGPCDAGYDPTIAKGAVPFAVVRSAAVHMRHKSKLRSRRAVLKMSPQRYRACCDGAVAERIGAVPDPVADPSGPDVQTCSGVSPFWNMTVLSPRRDQVGKTRTLGPIGKVLRPSTCLQPQRTSATVSNRFACRSSAFHEDFEHPRPHRHRAYGAARISARLRPRPRIGARAVPVALPLPKCATLRTRPAKDRRTKPVWNRRISF